MFRSLPSSISSALQAGKIDIALELVHDGLHHFPEFSYYKFLYNYLNSSLSKVEMNSISFVSNHQLADELSASWKTEIGSNYLLDNTQANKSLIRDSSYIICPGEGISAKNHDDNLFVALTREATGYVFHGPYRRFGAGNYELSIEFELEDDSIDSEDFNFSCIFDVTDNSEAVIYSVDSQSIIQNSRSPSKVLYHKANITFDFTINKLVIRALVVVPANVKLYLPRLKLV